MPDDELMLAVGRADSFYRERGQPGRVRDSVSLLQSVSGRDSHYEVQWRLSRAFFFLGQESTSGDEARGAHLVGIHAGKRAKTLSPVGVEGRFWLGVNLALFSAVASTLDAIFAIGRARRELRKAIRIDESYHGAGPLRVLGRLEQKAPALLGGSKSRARSRFRRALMLAPDNPVTLIYSAELEIELKRPERARELLETILNMKQAPGWEFELRRDRERAARLLAELG